MDSNSSNVQAQDTGNPHTDIPDSPATEPQVNNSITPNTPQYPPKSVKKIIATVFAFLLLTTSIGVGVYLTQKEQRTKVGAAGVNLSLTTTNASPMVGDNFVVAVNMNPNGFTVNGVDLRINYDSNLLTATSITPGNLLTNVLIQGSITTGTAMIVVGAPIDSNGPHPVTTSGLIAQVAFKAKSAGSPTSVSFGSLTTVSVANQTQNYAGTLTPVTITVRSASPTPPSKTPTATPTRTPSPTPSPSASASSKTPTPTPQCTTRPACLDSKPPCTIPEPVDGWCATPTPTPMPGDVNRDGHVTIVDVGILVDNYNKTPITDARADIDGNGAVNIVDVGLLIDNYGK